MLESRLRKADITLAGDGEAVTWGIVGTRLRKENLLKVQKKVGFYVFLTYLPFYGEHKVSRFENKFLIVPSEELEERMKVKDPGKRDVYSFCFHFEGSNVWDERVTVN